MVEVALFVRTNNVIYFFFSFRRISPGAHTRDTIGAVSSHETHEVS